jgi:hypothetical protein
MRFTKVTGIRLSVLAAALALASACGNTNSPKPVNGTSTDIVATVPEPPAPSDAPTTASSQSVTVSKVVWDDYQAYLTKVGRIGNGYYAVTEDGNGGASWACGEAFCGAGYDGKTTAMTQCQNANTGKTCVLFAKDDRILMKYELAQ